MGKFSEHFKMNEEDILQFALEKLDLFSSGSRLKAEEIGDGNINYVYRIWDEESGNSVVIKQADVELRTNPGRLLDLQRNKIEADSLIAYGKCAPEFVPVVYDYDPVMCALSMEDLTDHGNLRHELLERKIFPYFADHITTFMVNTLLPTVDIAMDPWEKKRRVKSCINIELCDISEKLVFTEPYTDKDGTNIILDENLDYVKKEIYTDGDLILEAGKLKYNFMNNAQALIHGDLHTGSIFVKEDSTKIIDPEFAFYGPIGYDVGNVIGNLFFPWMNAFITMDESEQKREFLSYIETTIEETADLFIAKFKKCFPEIVQDIMAKQPGYMEWFLRTVMEDTAGTAGQEIIRRVVGDAKVVDVTGIEDISRRVQAERYLIQLGKALIKERSGLMKGRDYLDVLCKIMSAPS